MIRTIKISFADFWPNFNSEDNFFVNVLKKKYEVKVVPLDSECDILIYSIFGYENLKYHDCIRLYYTGENDVPNFNLCDYAISFHHIGFRGRHFRLPLYAVFPAFDILRKGRRMTIPDKERGFCSYVVSNNWCSDPIRNKVFEELSNYKFVASGGRHANNVGGPVADKLAFLNQYKFNIAFENSSVEGYTTEKIFDALAARTVPIYWGNPLASMDINPESYININDFKSLEDGLAFVKQVDNDSELYNKFLNANPLLNNGFLDWETDLMSFLTEIIDKPVKYVPEYGLGADIHLHALEKEEMYHSETFRKLLAMYKWIKNIKRRNFV